VTCPNSEGNRKRPERRKEGADTHTERLFGSRSVRRRCEKGGREEMKHERGYNGHQGREGTDGGYEEEQVGDGSLPATESNHVLLRLMLGVRGHVECGREGAEGWNPEQKSPNYSNERDIRSSFRSGLPAVAFTYA
jgi:hypothetical protein